MDLYNINQYPVLGGNWHVGHQIGKGSSSIVRMGWDIKLQNHVALKYINEDAGWERKREGSIIKYKSIRNSPFHQQDLNLFTLLKVYLIHQTFMLLKLLLF